MLSAELGQLRSQHEQQIMASPRLPGQAKSGWTESRSSPQLISQAPAGGEPLVWSFGKSPRQNPPLGSGEARQVRLGLQVGLHNLYQIGPTERRATCP
jgi:hypothetical protein